VLVCVKTNFISHSIKLILTPFAGGRTTAEAAHEDANANEDTAGSDGQREAEKDRERVNK